MNTFKQALTATLLALSIGSAYAADNAVPEHQTQGFLNALAAGGGRPLEQLSPKDAREVLTGAQNSVKVDMSGIEVSDKIIKADGQTIKLTIVRPANVKGELPVFMYFHGGGWVLGDYPTHARLIRDLVVGSGAVAVYVDYTPSPEAHYPTAINQAYGHAEGDAVLQALSHSLLLNLRRQDLLCRLAGDRFVVLLPNTGERQAQVLAQELQQAVRALAHKTRQQGERLQLAATTAVVMALDEPPQDLLKRLNLALAKAKQPLAKSA